MSTVLNDARKGIDFIGITATFMCHDGKGNLLMSKRSQTCRDEQGAWEFGGGSMEFGDTIFETLERELAEEYTTKIIAHKQIGIRESFRTNDDGTKTHWIGFDHLLEVDRDMVSIGEPDKIADVGWFKFDELPQPRHSTFPTYVEKYGDILKAL